jgi:hypothetical protein
MSLSKRTRFEVFKRDKFTCQYCGKKAPDVVLHCDHIEPRSKGGSDDMVNLVTACDTCNGGKGAIRLADDTAVEKQRGQLERLQERQEQIEMMLQWHKALAGMDDRTVDDLGGVWCDLAGWFGLNETGKRELKKLTRKFGPGEVMEAMRIASETYFRYAGDAQEPTAESAQAGFWKIGGICRVRSQAAEAPYMPDVFYIRGILRNRADSKQLSYVNEREIIDMLKWAFERGAHAEDVKDIAKRVTTWNQWCLRLSEYVSSLGEAEGSA